jgi:signal transduction histidine kinase/DNA-binding response OmpR family regulator/ligand-binding sensor domain-containing protein
VFIPFLLSAQKDFTDLPPKFQNLTINDGLSNLAIHSICQDDLGYIWIGTARGLNRYDGLSFKHFYYNEDETSLDHDNIVALHKAPGGDIFCSTSSGVNIYSIKKEKFIRLKEKYTGFISYTNYDSVLYAARRNSGIFQYTADNMEMTRVKNIPVNLSLDALISTEYNGIWGKSSNNQFIINYNPSTSSYEKYILPDTDTLTIGGTIANIKNRLIISTNSSISIFNIKKKEFENISENFQALKSIQDKNIVFISEFDTNIYWIGTKANGLYIYNMSDQTLANHTATKDANTLNSNHLTYLLKDNASNIWLGTFDRGIEIAFEQRKNFNFDLVLHNFTKNKFITSMCTDFKGTYYFGTRMDGLHIYNAKTKKTSELNQKNSFIQENHIVRLFLSSNNKLWISSEKQLYILDLATNQFRIIELPRPHNGLVSFCESNNRIYGGSSRQGLLVFSLEGELLNQKFDFGPNIRHVLERKNGKLVVTSHGIGCFEWEQSTDQIVKISETDSLAKHDFSQAITSFLDSKENLWVGNFKFGLYRISNNKKRIDVFNMKSGLPSNDITGIVEDIYGNIWISSAYGLSMLNQEDILTNYSYNEGLENIQFHQEAVLKDEHGTLYFGGNFGLTFFNPKVLDLNKAQAPLVILEKIKVSNRNVVPDDDTKILTKNLALTSGITLSHHYPDFSIEFRGLDYVVAKNLKYAYRLEGSNNEEWNYVDQRTFASYQNLKPGDYIFQVKAQNNNGTWSEKPTTLAIKIKPAPWFTIWAFSGYFITLFLLTLGTFRLILRAKLYRKELEIEHNERIRENEISQMKMRFFTNISHEIRTPVTLIKGNVDYLMSELNENNMKLKSTDSLKNSTERLLKLINQLLSFRQLENDALDLKVRMEDIHKITNDIVESFHFTAKLKYVSIHVETAEEKMIIPVDKDKYEKILNNLLSNSLKFSKRRGAIKIIIEKQSSEKLSNDFKVNREIKNYLKVSVIDNGKGISASDLPHIFDRFVRYSDKKTKPDYSGTGIGLNFTKRLIDLHKGSIIASSEEKKETCISFILPADERIYTLERLQSKYTSEVKVTEVPEPEMLGKDEPKRVILLAEDDIELNKFIQNALSDSYKVIPAFDGKEALKIAKNQLPHIIISDIMMPEMDGISLCRNIREDELISHIPIVLLTAKAEVQNKILGFKYGADEYITKPFELDILKVRIQNLIKQRSTLQQYYKKALPVEFKTETVNQFEINFMKKINIEVEENYKSPEFNVNQLAENMNMSRSSFYRKFMSITDTSPKDYITNFRINKAIELIHQGYESFGEISFMCGFSSQSIFSIAFKKEKGLTPLQFKRLRRADASNHKANL